MISGRSFETQQPRGFDRAVGGGFDTQSKRNRGTLPPFKNGVKMAVVSVKLDRQLHDVGDGRTKISHAYSMGTHPIECKGYPYGLLSHMNENSGMDTWEHRGQFKAAVKRHREAKGIKLSEVAHSIGIKEQTLKDYLYRKDVKPSLEVLQNAASVFGCSVVEFLSDPGAPPPGITPEAWAEASDRSRVLSSMIFADLTKLPEEEQETYYQLWRQAMYIGRTRMEEEAKAKAKKPGEEGKKP